MHLKKVDFLLDSISSYGLISENGYFFFLQHSGRIARSLRLRERGSNRSHAGSGLYSMEEGSRLVEADGILT